jgi:hypothetical protein
VVFALAEKGAMRVETRVEHGANFDGARRQSKVRWVRAVRLTNEGVDA